MKRQTAKKKEINGLRRPSNSFDYSLLIIINVAVFNEGIGFLCGLKLFALNILQPSLYLMFQIC